MTINKVKMRQAIAVKRERDAKKAKLTRKQKNFADTLLNNPKMSATEAAERTYDVANRQTASAVAVENLRKPSILRYMNAQTGMAEQRIIELTQSENERIALDASKDILDRTQGKAVARSESINATVNIEDFLNGKL